MNAAQLVEQQLPYKLHDQVVHKRWTVDTAAAARMAGIAPARMAREADEMARHFSRWILTVAVQRELVRCARCDAMLVFESGLRCAQCGTAPRNLHAAARPAWFGVMPPVGIDGLTNIRDRIQARPPRQHVVGFREGIGNYLLVPLVCTYTAAFPQEAPYVSYLPEFKELPGIPQEEVSHTFHVVGHGRMCLFAQGEWYPEMTAREVLQQRAYPHVIKFLNYANGKRNAFAIVS